MTSQALSVPRAPCRLGEPSHRLSSIAIAASIAALFIVGAAEGKQQCNVEAGKHGYWSWRMIDGRKCWYEGKPMLSRTMLEWPAERAAEPDTRADTANAAPVSRRPESQEVESHEGHGDPMDAQAYAPADSSTFEALWRDRIEGSGR